MGARKGSAGNGKASESSPLAGEISARLGLNLAGAKRLTKPFGEA